jgi:uncharacterized protein YndB with AHSA1/START domain
MSSAPNEIVLTRIVNATRPRVWQMFTQPEHIQHWWGPNGFTNTIFEMEVRVGGLWRYLMHGPAGADGSPGIDYNNWIRYTSVVEPALLAYDHGGDDEVNPEFRASITLEDLGNQTRVTLRLELQSAEQRQRLVEFGAVQGGEQTLARLDAYVSPTPDDQCFIIERSFDAPLARVWKAWAEPAQFGQWWGPKGCTLKVKKMDFVEGGEFHYAMTWPGAPDMWGKFVYGRIVPGQSIEWVNSFSNEAGQITRAPFPGMENWPLQVFNTLTLSEKDGKTFLQLRGGPINALAVERTQFAGFFDSLSQGFGGTLDQLEAHLKEVGSER